jgi:hypothetical protein
MKRSLHSIRFFVASWKAACVGLGCSDDASTTTTTDAERHVHEADGDRTAEATAGARKLGLSRR